jgi:hypothetical protein
MLQEFVRLAVYVPVDVQEILRTFREFDFAGSVGTYRAVAEISSGVETFVPTADAAPTHGVAGSASTVPSARLVTYIPAGTPGEELDRLVDAIASVHPWEHPLIELDRVSEPVWKPSTSTAGDGLSGPAACRSAGMRARVLMIRVCDSQEQRGTRACPGYAGRARPAQGR